MPRRRFPLVFRDDRAAVDSVLGLSPAYARSVAPFSNKAGGVKCPPVRAERSEPLTSSARLRRGQPERGAAFPEPPGPPVGSGNSGASDLGGRVCLRAPRGHARRDRWLVP